MQHYIYYGYGFNAKLLKNEDISILLESDPHPSKQNVLARLISYTEEDPDIDWSSFVILELGQIPNAGKMISKSELDKIFNKNSVISEKLKKEFEIEMERVGLLHLADKIEFIIYSTEI